MVVVVAAEVTATELVDVEGEVTEEVTELVSLDEAPIPVTELKEEATVLVSAAVVIEPEVVVAAEVIEPVGVVVAEEASEATVEEALLPTEVEAEAEEETEVTPAPETVKAEVVVELVEEASF